MKHLRAYSLLEVLIAATLLTVMASACLQLITMTRSYSGSAEASIDVEEESARMISAMTQDLGNSSVFNGFINGAATVTMPRRIKPTGQKYIDLEFVRLRASTVLPAKSQPLPFATDTVAFNASALSRLPVRMSDGPNARACPGLMLTDPTSVDSSDRPISVAWETWSSGGQPASGSNDTSANDLAYLRRWRYTLTDQPGTALLMLSRQFRDGTDASAPWVTQEVLSRRIYRFTVVMSKAAEASGAPSYSAVGSAEATINSALSANQIHFSWTLQDEAPNRGRAHYQAQVTVAMRSISQ